MSIHLSMNLLRSMLAATSDVELSPATDDAVKAVRKAGAPKDLLEMYRIGVSSGPHVEMNGVRLYSIDGAIEKNAEAAVLATFGNAGYFVFASTVRGAVFSLDLQAPDEATRAVVRFDRTDRHFEGGRRVVAPSLDAFVFAVATNAVPTE